MRADIKELLVVHERRFGIMVVSKRREADGTKTPRKIPITQIASIFTGLEPGQYAVCRRD